MVKGKTKTGFKYEINEALKNDAEFLELFAKMSEGDSVYLFKMIERLLGSEQKAKLYEHCRAEDGTVPLDVLTAELLDIIAQLGKAEETKKSLPSP